MKFQLLLVLLLTFFAASALVTATTDDVPPNLFNDFESNNNNNDTIFNTTTTTASPEQNDKSLWSDKQSVGAIIGGCLGVIGVLLVVLYLKKSSKFTNPNQQQKKNESEYQNVR